jgi:3-phosphoshikimate 1-carboxyvinyltransferase
MSTSSSYTISHPTKNVHTSVLLPSSKSESNRSLIINALSGNLIELDNISEARDTQTMLRLLKTEGKELDVLDAGTTMRFLTAYCAVKGLNKILTGTERMQERPIKILVDALRELGADIKYLRNDGFPPIEINGFKYSGKKTISVRGDVSSQYISALLMIGPALPEGIEVVLDGKVGSRPYIEMTLSLMELFGASYSWKENVIKVEPKPYQSQRYFIESDWSGSSYWFSIAALAEKAEIELVGLKKNSLQGDSKIVEIMRSLGIETTYIENGVRLKKIESKSELNFDFSHCPDLAQTVFVICAAKKIKLTATGLESLRIKETDRIAALQNELAKIGSEILENAGVWQLVNSKNPIESYSNLVFDTYDDHRMAMAFAPLACLNTVVIDNPSVVNKSYPGYWNDLKKAGFVIK